MPNEKISSVVSIRASISSKYSLALPSDNLEGIDIENPSTSTVCLLFVAEVAVVQHVHLLLPG